MELRNFQEWIVERHKLLERIKELEDENVELRKRLGEWILGTVLMIHSKMKSLSSICQGTPFGGRSAR